MLDLETKKGRVIAATLRLAGECPWSEVGLAEIARAADVSLAELRSKFEFKGEILAAFTRAIDDEVLERMPKPEEGQAARDAIFEVVMTRFDVLGAYKPALKSIVQSWSPDATALGALLSSQAWMLRAAGVPAEGLTGQLRVAGLGALYASVFRTWLEDDDPGQAKTMAVLDRRLRRGERMLRSLDDAKSALGSLASIFTSRRRSSEPTEEPAPTDPPPASSAS